METSTSIVRPASPAVAAARAAVSALRGNGEDALLQHAFDVADIVAGLGANDEVVLGALAMPLLKASALDEARVVQAGASSAAKPNEPFAFDKEATRLARELAQLGSFGARWNPAGKLSAAQAETLRKMLLAVATDPRLILLRLADRLAALREAKRAPEAEQKRLALEAREIYAPLANRLGVWQLKWELEDLAFRYLDGENYKRIAAALNARRTDRERYIHDVRAQLESELSKAGIAAEVTGRPKHINSIWKKMQRKQVAFEQVFDVRALRVLVDSVSDCYAALGIVHGLWPYIEQEFDDYIATPKGNAYRSIHTAVYGPGHQPLEVQIRTREMHDHAELGVAAHWKYKEGGGMRDAAYEAKINWVRQLLKPAGADVEGHGDSGSNSAGESDFLDRVSGQLFEDRIYVMTPKGEVIDLPKGATPLDFAYHVHTDLGHRSRGAKINGRIVPLTHHLSNGEVVEILTGKVAQPNRDWMSITSGFLASNRSRNKVRAYFRKLDEAGHKPEAAADAAPVRVIPPPAPPRRARPNDNAAPKGVIVEGVNDLPFNLARCCSPTLHDPIVGYITLTRGISIHRQDCPSLLRMKSLRPDRLFNVAWGAAKKSVARH